MAVAMVGAVVAIGSAIFGGRAQKAAAESAYQVAKANRAAQKQVREANNVLEGSSAALSNFMRSRQNQQLMKVAGEEYNALGNNIARLQDNYLQGDIASQIQNAEQMGQVEAAAAAMGVRGSTVDMIQNTMTIGQNMQSNYNERTQDFQVFDIYNQRNNVISNAVLQMDNAQTFANMNYNQEIMPFIDRPSSLSTIVQGIGNALPYISTAMQNWQARSLASTPVVTPAATTTGSTSSGASIKI